MLSDTKMEIAGVEEDLIQIKTESRKTKQKLMAEQEEIKQENLTLKLDTLTLHSKKENLLCDVGVLDKLKSILYKLLSMIPVVREFARLVEEKKDMRTASPYGYTTLGRLLKEYRIPFPRYDRLVIFPEIASWLASIYGCCW